MTLACLRRLSVGFAVVVVTLLASTLAWAAKPTTPVERGQALLRVKGCAACHSLDGTPRSGPTFKGMWGRSRPVQERDTGDTHPVTIDEAYVARSLRDPDAQIAAGYPRGSMPRFDLGDEDVAAIAAALREIESAPGNVQSSGQRGGSIVPLALSAAAFAGLHFLLSSLSVRRRVIAKMGDKGFSGLYSALAFTSFIAMVWFYRLAPYVEVWSPPRVTRWVPVVTMPVAMLFLVAGFSTPSPTMVAQGAIVTKEDDGGGRPKGILAVTRHPALWGFALWAVSHLATNGELHVVLVALSIAALAFGGMLHIDARRAAALGDAWGRYTAKTSVLPFAAMVSGRAKLRFGEIGIVRVLIAGFLYYAILHAHAFVIGASPYP